MITKLQKDERGSALTITLLILVLVTVMGIAAINTSNIEIKIAGNQKLHEIAFYNADGGTEVAIEIVEQNIASAGFDDAGSEDFEIGNITGISLNLYLNPSSGKPSDANRDAYLPKNYKENDPHTNLNIGGNPNLSTGSAIQMAGGYEGGGKGAAGGGSFVVYDIWSQYRGDRNSESVIRLQWMHVM